MEKSLVYKVTSINDELPLLVRQVEAVYGEIGQRAYLRFASRGGGHGFDHFDWLAAEQELIFSPLARLTENDREFRLQLVVPGLKASQIRINLLPNSIIVDGEPFEAGAETSESVCFSEFNNRKLLRKVDLPQEINTSEVTTFLDQGLLDIIAQKAAPATIKPVERFSAARA